MATLKSTHNAGFFSCSTIALMDIVKFVNDNGKLPFRWDRKEQFSLYKTDPDENLIPYYFSKAFEKAIPLPIENIELPDCMAIQFGSYKTLPFAVLKPYVTKYFTPSQHVMDVAVNLSIEYKLFDTDNLCAVFYRGNDKAREMHIPSHEIFIKKARDIREKNGAVKFLVQTDSNEFLTAFLDAFPDSIYFLQLPRINKQDNSVTDLTPQEDRKEFGARYLAAVICLARCKTVITHSGNGALWLALYRGNGNGINQIHNGEWL